MDHRIRIAPLSTEIPVSATGSLFVEGRTIDGSQLEVRKEFSFDKAFSAKLKQKEVELMLGDDLARLAEEAGGNAIVNLTVALAEVRACDLNWIYLERYVGLFSAVGGLVYLVSPLYWSGGSSSESLIAGGVLAGTGAALIGGSFLHESVGSTAYSFRISVEVVRY
jgi:hypothetical protein